MKIVTVVGARPQFVKASAVSRRIRAHHTEVLVHTGQHYDAGMSDVFFRELDIPQPEYHLGVGSGRHGEQTGAMLAAIERVLVDERPDWMLVYGDTNSTLAGALAAAKLSTPVAHVEAGLRSFNRAMPEEINRVVTDHLASLLLCPSDVAERNLATEGITGGVHVVGDVMADVLFDARARAVAESRVMDRVDVTEGAYALVTVHRAENTDAPERLRGILDALDALPMPVVFPVHPRTRGALARIGYAAPAHVQLLEPQGYLDIIRLQLAARVILTDSGGVQKEAYWLGVPCVTLREETEWVETVERGWNVLTGANTERIQRAVDALVVPTDHAPLYGAGDTAARIVALLEAQAP